MIHDLLSPLNLSQDGWPLLLNFFRSDCPWCALELPRWGEVYARHPHLTLHIVGIAVGDDTPESAAQFARDKALPFPVIADTSGALKAAFDLERVPSVVAINAHGLVERTYEGATEQVRGILEQTLFALAQGTEPPEYDMVGNGCAP